MSYLVTFSKTSNREDNYLLVKWNNNSFPCSEISTIVIRLCHTLP